MMVHCCGTVFVQKEEERLRAAVRRESLQKRVREKHSRHSGGITASYLEPEEVMRFINLIVSCSNDKVSTLVFPIHYLISERVGQIPLKGISAYT